MPILSLDLVSPLPLLQPFPLPWPWGSFGLALAFPFALAFCFALICQECKSRLQYLEQKTSKMHCAYVKNEDVTNADITDAYVKNADVTNGYVKNADVTNASTLPWLPSWSFCHCTCLCENISSSKLHF